MTIPNSVTSIGTYAFNNCRSLTSISLPDSVSSIGTYAFYGCIRLTDITIPNSVTSIEESTFAYCHGLTSISFPSSVAAIKNSAFRESGLTSIMIPKSITSIGKYAFSSCRGLKSITVESGNTTYDSRDNCNAIIETASNTLIAGCNYTIIPNSVTAIGDGAFQRMSLTDITIPNSVTSIGAYVFCECYGLKSIIIPNSVTIIGRGAFQNCEDLSSISIPRSVVSIGDNAFRRAGFKIVDAYCYVKDPSQIEMGSCVFYNDGSQNYSQCTLYVPVGSVEAYETDMRWSNYFGRIVEMTDPYSDIPGDVNGDGKISINDVTNLIDILLSGGDIPANADVNGDGNVSIKDVTDLIDMLLSGN